jgi:hypothetical protein
MTAVVDTAGLGAVLRGAGDAMARAWHTASLSGAPGAASLLGPSGPASVVLIGVGVSAFAARVAVVAARPVVPVVVVDTFVLPAFVGKTTLAVFAGSSREIRATVAAATDRGAGVIELATDGSFDDLSGRMLLGAQVAAWMRVLVDAGMADQSIATDVAEAARRLDALVPTLLAPDSEPARLARSIDRLFPYVLGTGEASGLAAEWWARQWALTVKGPVFTARLPQLAHADIAMFGQNGDVSRAVLVSVVLRAAADGPSSSGAIAPLVDVLDEVTADVLEVAVDTGGLLTQMVELAVRGDAVALHRSGAEGLDPGPVPAVDDFVARLG